MARLEFCKTCWVRDFHAVPIQIFNCICRFCIGHSFFILIANEIPEHAQRLGRDDPNASIFRDEKGHGHEGGILLTLSDLIWLATIYHVDMNTYDFDGGFDINLKQLTQAIVDNYNSASLCCVLP